MIRRAYLKKVKQKLEDLEDDIGRLQKRVEGPMGALGDRMDREGRNLRAKAESVREKIRAVEAAGASGWGRLKSAVDDALEDLGRAIDEAVERIRKAGSGDG